MNKGHLENQIAALAKVRRDISRGEHVGAGLSLSIQVGAAREDKEPTRLTLSAGTEEVLKAIESALAGTLQLSHVLLRSELRDMQDMMETLDTTDLKEGGHD